jgi:hypothetical protein
MFTSNEGEFLVCLNAKVLQNDFKLVILAYGMLLTLVIFFFLAVRGERETAVPLE